MDTLSQVGSVQHLLRCQECHMARPCAPLASPALSGAVEFEFEVGRERCCVDACLRQPQETAGPACTLTHQPLELNQSSGIS